MSTNNPDDMTIDELLEVDIHDYIGPLLRSDIGVAGIDQLINELAEAKEPYVIAAVKAEIMKASMGIR